MTDSLRRREVARVAALVLAAGLACAGASAQQFPQVPPPAAGRSAVPARSWPGTELLAELRKGGYVIYFRHTSTDFSRDDSRSKSDDDCDNQRPLTDKGREEARQIGAAFRTLKIPVEQVLASPRCRTMETAMLAFGRAEKADDVRGGPAAPNSPDRYAGLRHLLSTPPKPGANLVISSHGNPFYATAGAPYLAEGEGAVVRPLGQDFEIVARVRHDAWRMLHAPGHLLK
jgi:Histidine phosphatase superfamily (branch 1)